MQKINQRYNLSGDVLQAQQASSPIVALESVVITHSLPRPQNLELTRQMD